jgi:MFS family permease
MLASDPGLNRLRSAIQAVATIAAAMAAEWAFVRITGAMQIDTHGAVLPPAQAAVVSATNHGMLIIMIMVGAVVGMISAFTGGMYPTIRDQLIGFAMMPPLMVAGLAIGLPLSSHRPIALTLLVVILAAGAYCRRFGPLGFIGGQMVFMGNFFGFFLGAQISIRDIGWLAAAIVLAVVVAMIGQFTLFYPRRRAAFRRLERSYDARRRELLDHALRMLASPGRAGEMSRDLDRRMRLLNETALMIDAHLNHPAALPPGWSADVLHQILFDVELSVSNMGRFAGAVATRPEFRGSDRALVSESLVAVRDGDVEAAERGATAIGAAAAAIPASARAEGETDGLGGWHGEDVRRIVLHRLSLSVGGHCQVQRQLREERRLAESPDRERSEDGIDSPVVLVGGWLPGSALVSAEASTLPDTRTPDAPRWRQVLLGHVPLAPNVRVTVQMAVAVTAAVLLGEVLSGRRFYWAVIAAFVTFMGANSATEQVRKGFNRVLGTVVGVLVGGLLAHLVGPHGWIAIAVILCAIFFGIYLMRVSYAFMVIGITVMVSQMYMQLDEFTNSLLLLRLEETALGAAVAAATVLCVFPLRTRHVARLSSQRFLEAVDEVVATAIGVLDGSGTQAGLRADVRRMDDAFQTLSAVSAQLRVGLFDREGSQSERFMTAATGARHYARTLLADVPALEPGPGAVAGFAVAQRRFSESVAVLVRCLEHGTRDEPYVRSAALFDRCVTDQPDPAGTLRVGTSHQLIARDLELLDGALATMAGVMGLQVEALDTRAA